jgi:dihydrofolate reductase
VSGRFKDQIDQVFVIGGQQIFEMALQSPQCQKIYATHIDHVFDCDTFFPPFADRFAKAATSSVKSEKDFSFFFAEYTRR